jgi:hypothetical protein
VLAPPMAVSTYWSLLVALEIELEVILFKLRRGYSYLHTALLAAHATIATLLVGRS